MIGFGDTPTLTGDIITGTVGIDLYGVGLILGGTVITVGIKDLGIIQDTM